MKVWWNILKYVCSLIICGWVVHEVSRPHWHSLSTHPQHENWTWSIPGHNPASALGLDAWTSNVPLESLVLRRVTQFLLLHTEVCSESNLTSLSPTRMMIAWHLEANAVYNMLYEVHDNVYRRAEYSVPCVIDPEGRTSKNELAQWNIQWLCKRSPLWLCVRKHWLVIVPRMHQIELLSMLTYEHDVSWRLPLALRE